MEKKMLKEKRSPKNKTATTTKHRHIKKQKKTDNQQQTPCKQKTKIPPKTRCKNTNANKCPLHSGLFSLRSGRVRTATRTRKRQSGQTISTTTRT